jgi:hypothetical protein
MTSLLLLALLSAYEEVPDLHGGSVRGRVTIAAPPAAAAPIAVTKDHGICGHEQRDETWVLGKDGGLANAVVLLDGIERGKPLALKPIEIDQRQCHFVPHVTAFPKGTKVLLKNSDGTLHNTHTYMNDKTVFNVAMPMKGMKLEQKIKEAGIIKLTCDAGHVWMRAWAYVTEHPYVTVTDADGRFTLTDVPAGTWKVKVWHEAAGERAGSVTVTPGSEATLDVGF